jgi:hypothetical protein
MPYFTVFLENPRSLVENPSLSAAALFFLVSYRFEPTAKQCMGRQSRRG